MEARFFQFLDRCLFFLCDLICVKLCHKFLLNLYIYRKLLLRFSKVQLYLKFVLRFFSKLALYLVDLILPF